MHNFMKRLAVLCFFAAAAMIVALPASAGTQGKTDAKQAKKEAAKTSGCCTDKKGADAKACADDKTASKDCCADGKEGKHTKAEHEKMMKEKEGEKKDEGKKDGDGR